MNDLAGCLRDHRLSPLFIDVLGWECASGALTVTVDGNSLSFRTIAHKRGLQVLWCQTDRLVLMNRALLRKLQRHVARTIHEHVLIFTSEEPRKQVWQWAVRQPDGRRVRHREHPFFSAEPPAGLLHRLSQLRFDLDEEETVTLVDALDRVRQVLDTTPDLHLFVKWPWYARRSDEVARAMRQGDVGAFHRFILLHRPLARKISQRLYRWFGLPEEDAKQIGILGLIKAARRFEPERGVQFSTYANWWVKHACQRLGPDSAYLIRVPAYLFWPCFRHAAHLARLRSIGSPSRNRGGGQDLELLNPPLANRWQAYLRATTIVSLSDRKTPEYRKARQIPAPAPAPAERSSQLETVAVLLAALRRLPVRDAEVVRLRYGLGGREHTLKEIGELMNLTRERIRQIQNRAEAKLRELLVDQTPSTRS
jgi:RNA polymerase sigma factor (sigma-70 family)